MDARGARCPLPTLKAALALERLRPGQRVDVYADDSASWKDLPSWCRDSGHRMLEARSRAGGFLFRIEKGRPPRKALQRP